MEYRFLREGGDGGTQRQMRTLQASSGAGQTWAVLMAVEVESRPNIYFGETARGTCSWLGWEMGEKGYTQSFGLSGYIVVLFTSEED